MAQIRSRATSEAEVLQVPSIFLVDFSGLCKGIYPNKCGFIWYSTPLVGGFNHLEKYEFVNGKDEFVNGKDDNPYMKWKIKFMFETTNQL
jgi:hypothetical protein